MDTDNTDARQEHNRGGVGELLECVIFRYSDTKIYILLTFPALTWPTVP